MNQLPLNLLIADDHKIITEGLHKILLGETFIGNIFTAGNGDEAVQIAATTNIDCVIMDINMPLMNGVEATKLIKQQKPFVKIIIVSMLADASIVSKVLKAGADAFLNKDTGKSEILIAIDKVMNNEKYVSPDIAKDFFGSLKEHNNNSVSPAKYVTPREIEIIRHIADGLTNSEIAGKLFLSIATVDTHRKNILAKLRLKNTAALVKYAAEHQLL